MNKRTRLAALLLCMALLCSLLPQLSLTARAEAVSGNCGAEDDNLTWTVNTDTGVLTISGSGAMADYYEWDLPWAEYTGSITTLVLPAGLTYIGDYAFYKCSGVTSVSLPAGLTGIGNNAFQGTGLTGISLPSGLTSIGDGAFSECTGLTSVSLPAGMTAVGWAAFYGCTGLKTVSLPSSLQYVDGYAFYGCTGLTGISIPSGVKGLGESAFSGCTGLTSITLPASMVNFGESAFAGCTGLRTVSFPDGLHYVGASAFSGCTGLTGVTLHNNMIAIDEGAFANCTHLTAISFPASIERIEQGAFSGCTGLTSLSIPSKLTSISEEAFSGCTGLKSLAISEGVVRIQQGAFSGCTGLTSVTFPDSLKSIGWRAFLNCTKLTKVTIPETVIGIGDLSLGYVSSGDSVSPMNGFTICGIIGSEAESYATRNGFTFVALGGVRNPFEDVHNTDFFYDPVMWALENDVTGGIDDTHFGPYNTVMRVDAMVFFWAAKGRPSFTSTNKTFKDVGKKHWAYNAVMWAVENGITGGTDAAGTLFSPQQTCSRSEILQFLYAAEGKPKYTISNPYSDVKNKHWYKDSAIWANEIGLEKGENGRFNAKTPCTRAYVVVYLYRYITKQQLAK